MYFLILIKGLIKSDYEITSITFMTQNHMNTPYAKRVAEKFRETQNYLKNNGFYRSTKHLLEDIENTVKNNG